MTKRSKEISGFKICRRALVINHLLFTDNNILFYKTNVEENRGVQHILKRYTDATGQLFNSDNTSMSFSQNVPNAVQEEI